MSDGSVSVRREREVALRVGAVLATAIIAIRLLSAEIPTNPLGPSPLGRQQLLSIFPQGWAFFTRDPQEPRVRLYEQGEGTWHHVEQRNAAWRYLAGLDRSARMRSVELAGIVLRVPPASWRTCAQALRSCANSDSLVEVSVRNSLPRPHICGSIILEERPPVPWAWARLRDHTFMKGRIAKLQVACSKRPS